MNQYNINYLLESAKYNNICIGSEFFRKIKSIAWICFYGSVIGFVWYACYLYSLR